MKLHNIARKHSTIRWQQHEENKPVTVGAKLYGKERDKFNAWKGRTFPEMSLSELTKRAIDLYMQLHEGIPEDNT